jgi:hypothetical protein
MSDDDYSNYPQSVAEIRSDKTWRAIDWTPRDALISCLRDIDSGKIKPDSLLICWSVDDGGDNIRSTYRAAGGSFLENLGLLERLKHMMQQER